MLIKRIDQDRNEKDANRIEIVIGDQKYTITDEFGALQIHSHSDYLDVRPRVANQISVKGHDS